MKIGVPRETKFGEGRITHPAVEAVHGAELAA